MIIKVLPVAAIQILDHHCYTTAQNLNVNYPSLK